MKARRGITIVEAVLASSIAVVVTLSVMEGSILACKLAHENSQVLAADAYAWDTAWKWFNKSYDDLPANSAGISYVGNIASNDCPMLCREMAGLEPVVKIRVTYCPSIQRHGTTVPAKLIEVDVAWGPQGVRKSLNGMAEEGTRTYQHPISLYKSDVDRGE